MADISKIILPNGLEYDVKDATARSELADKQDAITAEGILMGDGEGSVTGIGSAAAGVLSIDNLPIQNSANLITSGGVYAVIGSIESVLTALLEGTA